MEVLMIEAALVDSLFGISRYPFEILTVRKLCQMWPGFPQNVSRFLKAFSTLRKKHLLDITEPTIHLASEIAITKDIEDQIIEVLSTEVPTEDEWRDSVNRMISGDSFLYDFYLWKPEN